MEKFKTIGLLLFVALAVLSALISRLRFPPKVTQVPVSTPPQNNSSLICVWNDEESSGEVFLDQGRVYAIYDSQGSRQHYLLKDNCVWSWQQGYSTGTKVCQPSSGDITNAGYFLLPNEENLAQNLNCQPAELYDSVFLPPPEIIFTESDVLTEQS